MEEKADILQHEVASDHQSRDIIDERKLSVNINPRLAAILETDKPNPWGKGYLNLYFICFLIFFCSTMNGYDGSLMGSINAESSYTTYYNLPASGNSATGIVFAIFNVGQMVGALFIWTNDVFGRRPLIFVGCVGVVVGTIVTSTAKTLSIFVGGRFLLSFFATLAATSAPLYLIEIAPPQYRGTIAGMYNTLYYFGSIIATSVVYACFHNVTGVMSWRIPLWIQMLCPGIVCGGIFLAPESPRWLIGKGRADQARDILTKYHANGIVDHPLVNLEMAEMAESLRLEPMTNFRNFFDLRVLYRTRARRYRIMLNIAFSWFGQFSGNNVASYFLPKLLENVGITSTSTQLLLNIIYALTGWIPAMIGARMHDIIGRRKMMLGVSLGMAICLAIAAATAADFVNTGSIPASRASIAFIFIFGSTFAFAFTSMQPIYPGEVLSNDMRAKGMGVYQITSGCASFVNTFAAPVALNKIGYWFYVFFVFFDIFEFVFIYFFFVETKGRTLEELDEIFDAPNPRKASTAKHTLNRQTVRDQRTGVEKEEVFVADQQPAVA